MSIENKITNEFTLRNDVLTEEDQENLQEFIHIFASKFDLDFRKDIRISVRAKHNEDGANLLIKVSENETDIIDSRQLNLFDESKKNGQSADGGKRGHGKTVTVPDKMEIVDK